MNLLEGALTAEDGKTVFKGNGLTVPLPAGLIPPHSTQNASVTLGIRPEDIALRDLPEALQVTGTVELVEDLGADLLLHCRVGERRLVVRTARRADRVQGQTMTLFFPVDKLHPFIDHRRIDTPTAPPA